MHVSFVEISCWKIWKEHTTKPKRLRDLQGIPHKLLQHHWVSSFTQSFLHRFLSFFLAPWDGLVDFRLFHQRVAVWHHQSQSRCRAGPWERRPFAAGPSLCVPGPQCQAFGQRQRSHFPMMTAGRRHGDAQVDHCAQCCRFLIGW